MFDEIGSGIVLISTEMKISDMQVTGNYIRRGGNSLL
jgi:hypothetical protein